MIKDFNNWNTKKIKIDTLEKRPFFHVDFEGLRKKLKELFP